MNLKLWLRRLLVLISGVVIFSLLLNLYTNNNHWMAIPIAILGLAVGIFLTDPNNPPYFHGSNYRLNQLGAYMFASMTGASFINALAHNSTNSPSIVYLLFVAAIVAGYCATNLFLEA